jgi:phosphoribosylformimino-5-aminoimidazole carboxamide ribotide isomerase
MDIREASLTDVWQLRQEVMYPDKDIAFVQLDGDTVGVHLGLYQKEELVSAISLFVSDQELQFRKFATQIRYQGQGFGSTLLQYVMDWAQVHKCTLVWCNARLTATALYKRFGMKQVGLPWTKNGIEYIRMQKTL